MVLKTLFILCILIKATFAEETDQFTLPPAALEDVGPAVSSRLYKILEEIVIKTNMDIRMLQSRAKTSRHAASQLALRLKGAYIANSVYARTGPGFPRWLRGQPLSQYKVRAWDNVYWLVFSQSPLSFIGLAPTINMYQHYFGTDKLGHFFMQGHTYFTLYHFFLRTTHSAEKAHHAMITYGQILEHTYLGTLVNGVYSNGDLSANYAGWKFYMNLTQSIKIGRKTIAPILIFKNNHWMISSKHHKNTLLKPYISNHLNEALNPSHYAFMIGRLRSNVKKRCSAWVEDERFNLQKIENTLKETHLWYGEHYGHWSPKNSVNLLICFNANPKRQEI